MKELDYSKIQKNLNQYITPPKIRKFIAEEIGEVKDVFDPAVGSGQLLEYVKAVKKFGNEIDINSYKTAKENGITAVCSDFVDYPIIQEFDAIASNYPFSVKPDDRQKEIIENTDFMKPFLNNKGKFTGVLDYYFILKSFFMSKKNGYYICFCGITYRSQELKYRQYLIENKLVEKVIILENCKFERTPISVLYLKLSQNNDKILFGTLDLETDKKREKTVNLDEVIKENYDLSPNHYLEPVPTENEINPINISELELNLLDLFKQNVRKTLEFEKFKIEEAKGVMTPLLNEYLAFLESVVKEYKTVNSNNKNNDLEQLGLFD